MTLCGDTEHERSDDASPACQFGKWIEFPLSLWEEQFDNSTHHFAHWLIASFTAVGSRSMQEQSMQRRDTAGRQVKWDEGREGRQATEPLCRTLVAPAGAFTLIALTKSISGPIKWRWQHQHIQHSRPKFIYRVWRFSALLPKFDSPNYKGIFGSSKLPSQNKDAKAHQHLSESSLLQ